MKKEKRWNDGQKESRWVKGRIADTKNEESRSPLE